MSELKPCPFCPKSMVSLETSEIGSHHSPVTCYFICCVCLIKRESVCRTWLPEFGQDHECCDGMVMDVDEYTEGYDLKVLRVPCPICAKDDFSEHIQDLLVTGDHEEASDLAMMAHKATHRIKSTKYRR